ncbi:hypothetical protein J1N35_042726 [Gossypium stocksii]|uniref:Uncharacterized protein n=1 Tax=Gossypium stocksii TaxID=47602 RepID=A0A9D3U635_9ROSI|nr:hypothetical protein J1N35_042726 [Gossypium stocksii]
MKNDSLFPLDQDITSLHRKNSSENILPAAADDFNILQIKMFDSKYVINQVEEFQLILHEILVEGMVSCEFFQAATIIENFSSWNDFKNYLKHKRKEIRVRDLILV